MKKNNARLIWYGRAALVIIVVAALVAWWRIPAVNAFIQHSLAAFSALDQHAIERFIHAYGPQAALVSFALMILQAVVAPLPAFLITFANASLFGAFWGAALSWTSAMAGAALCFFYRQSAGP
ncbi:TVP38/TMEM64 family inner membrane protein ydjZ [Raoultella planticola]|nr:TVP38/TMEM64 family inner membrane protein ydjZ [Raoultella planticola]